MKNICKKIIGIVLVIILLVSTNISIAVSQTDINKQQNQQKENNNKINETKNKITEVQEIKDETLKEVENLNAQINEYQSQITSLETQINDANNKIKDSEEKLAQAEVDYKKQQTMLEQRMVAVYEAGETSYLDFLLTSQSLSDFISNYYLVSELTKYDTELLEKLQEQKNEIQKAKNNLEEGKNQLTTAKASKESVANQLQKTKKEKDAKVAQLSAEEQQLQSRIAELQKDNESINKKIQAMQAQIEAERKKAEEEANKNNNSNNSSSNSGTSSAGFIKPVNSYITTGMYYSSGAYHGAVDFGASGVNGMPIYAVADGIVVTTQALTTSYGNYIIIYHPSSNLYTLYAHGQAGSISVSQMQRVKQGQQIMRVGSTGNSSGPHLHFEVRTAPGYYSNRVNPANYLPK